MANKEGLFSLGQRERSWLNTGIILDSGNKPTGSEKKPIKREYKPEFKPQFYAKKDQIERNYYAAQKINLGLTDGYVEGKSVLEIGCGEEGTFVRGLLEEGKAKKVFGADREPVIKAARKQLSPEHSGNLFAVDLNKESADFPKKEENQKFEIVVLHAVLDHHVLPESRDRLKTNIKNVRKFMEDDGEAIIYPVNKESWGSVLTEYNSEHPRESVTGEFRKSREKTDPFDNNEYLVFWKGDGVNKGRFQC